MSDRIPLAERCRGRWRSILPMVGISAGLLTGRHLACPLCGGTDRFRFTDHDQVGAWICNQHGRGTGIDLVMQVHGEDFKAAAMRIEAVIGRAEVDAKPVRAERSQRQSMRDLWRSGVPVTVGCPVGRYLASRGLGSGPYPRCLRSARAIGLYTTLMGRDGSRTTVPTTWHPGMLAQVVGPDGSRAVNLHRTYLDGQGSKLAISNPRKLMSGTLPPGSAIRLAPVGPDGRLGVAEGIETALKAAERFGLPVWSLINAGNLAAFVPPPEVRELTIFGDNDRSFTGQAAAYTLAQRTHRTKIGVRVEIPTGIDTDWADELQAGAR